LRSYEEIIDDIKAANDKQDVTAMRTLADEMSAVGTQQAEAVAERTRGLVCRLEGEFSDAIKHMDTALHLFQQIHDRRGIASVTGNLGIVYYSLGRYADALDQYQRAVGLFDELGDRNAVAIFTGNVANVHTFTGRHEDALLCYQQALSIHMEHGDRPGAARVIGNMGNVYHNTGDYQTALMQYSRAMEMHQELGNLVSLAQVTQNIGIVYNSTGRYAEALEFSFRAHALYEETGNRAGVAMTMASIGNIYAVTGSQTEALEYLHRAMSMAEVMGDQHLLAVLHSNTGSRLGDDGETESALEHFVRARALYEQTGDSDGVGRVTGFIARALLDLDREEEAAATLDELAAMHVRDPRARAHCLALRGTVAERRGDLDAAVREISQALAISVEAGIRSQEAEYHMRLRDLARLRSDFDAYVLHNEDYVKINEEIRGKEATQRMTMIEAERTIEHERREREKERALLYGALPRAIADRMIRGEDVSSDHYDSAAVMFMDIVGFTSNTSRMPPATVLKVLEEIFRSIDAICDAHGVVKVKTIGDSYMCFRGDASADINALSAARLAVEVMQLVFTWPTGDRVQFRAGLHIGPVTAGVIGTQRLQYDVWGDTVNVASRMESTSEPGRIQVSEAFAEGLGAMDDEQEDTTADASLAPRPFTLAPRGAIEIKGKGTMSTYWLEGA